MTQNEKEYFSHEYHARNDPKMVSLQMSMGMEGWGIFWAIVEMLYCEEGYIMLSQCQRIAFELRSECDKINKVVNDFFLFEKDSEKFWSPSVLRRLDLRKSKSKVARESANKRWKNANALPSQSDSNAIKEKQSKAKQSKEEEEERAKAGAREEKNYAPPPTDHAPVIPITKNSENGSKVSAPPPEISLIETEVDVSPTKKITVAYHANGNHNSLEISQWLGGMEFQLAITQTGLSETPDDYLAYVVSEFASMLITDDDCHRKKYPFRLKTFYSSRAPTLLKTFNQKQNTLEKFKTELDGIPGIAPEIKKEFWDYYTRSQPAGNCYFEQRKNFIVSHELKSWVDTQHKKATNGNHNGTYRKDHSHRPVITGTATTAGSL